MLGRHFNFLGLSCLALALDFVIRGLECTKSTDNRYIFLWFVLFFLFPRNLLMICCFFGIVGYLFFDHRSLDVALSCGAVSAQNYLGISQKAQRTDDPITTHTLHQKLFIFAAIVIKATPAKLHPILHLHIFPRVVLTTAIDAMLPDDGFNDLTIYEMAAIEFEDDGWFVG